MKMNGARILVEELIHQGVEVIFGYPGGAVLNIYDELYLASDRIRHVLSAHEQGAAHAADGYARASGKTGVVLATSGPGATNLVTGIANAYLDSVPMVAITGNVAVSSLGKDSFQEVDIVGITQPDVYKRQAFEVSQTIEEAEKAAGAVEEEAAEASGEEKGLSGWILGVGEKLNGAVDQAKKALGRFVDAVAVLIIINCCLLYTSRCV